LYDIVKRRHLGRRVRQQEYGPDRKFQKDYGPLLDLMKAAAAPFSTTKGSEADVKAVLLNKKRASGKQKSAAATRR
jgi:hypothetical protein